MVPSIILTLPIIFGKVEAWRRFVQEIAGIHKGEHEAARLRQGITRERLALLETQFGATSVTTFEAGDVSQAITDMLTSTVPFDRWYRTQVQGLHGITLAAYEQYSQQAALSDSHLLLFDWIPPEPVFP